MAALPPYFADATKYPMLGIASGRGGVAHLVPDMVRAIAPPAESCLVCAAFDGAEAAPACEALGVGFNEFCALGDYKLLLTQRNSAIGCHASAPSSDDVVACDNGGGRRALKVSELPALGKTIGADVVLAMSEPLSCDAEEPLNKKRRVAAARCASWAAKAQEPNAEGVYMAPNVPVVPDNNAAPWRTAAIAGIPDTNLNEDPAKRLQHLAACAAAAPKTVFVFSADTLGALIDGVVALDGRCIVSTPLALQLARRGLALCEGGVVNLWDPAFDHDRSRLVEGCTCAACQRHTRGYLHHLLRVHEMNSDMLLLAHNLHTAADAVRRLRAAGPAGRAAEAAALKKQFGCA